MLLHSVLPFKKLCGFLLYFVFLYTLLSGSAVAAPWRIGANIMAAEEYTDRVRGGGQERQGRFVTELSPGINIRRQGARIGMAGEYNYHHRLYSGDRSDTGSHSLRAAADAELLKNRLFTNAFSYYRRQITDPLAFLPISPSSSADNQNDVWTNGVSARLINRYKRFARSAIVYSYSTTEQIKSSRSSTDQHKASASLTSGSDFSRVFWGLSYDYSKSRVLTQNYLESQAALAKLGYRFTKKLSAFLTVGYEENPTGRIYEFNRFEGIVKTLSVDWVPTRKWSFSAMYGDRSFGETYDFSFNWRPTVRSNFRASYGRGTFGQTYSAFASHRKRKSIWNLQYSESLITRANLEAQVQITSVLDDEGNIITNEAGDSLFSFDIVNVLRDDTFIGKNLSAGVTFTGRYTKITFGLKYGQRVFETLGYTDDLYSGSATVTRELGKRSSVSLNGIVLKSHFAEEDRVDTTTTYQASYDHRLGKTTQFSVILRYLNRLSSDDRAEQSDYLIRAQISKSFGH